MRQLLCMQGERIPFFAFSLLQHNAACREVALYAYTLTLGWEQGTEDLPCIRKLRRERKSLDLHQHLPVQGGRGPGRRLVFPRSLEISRNMRRARTLAYRDAMPGQLEPGFVALSPTQGTFGRDHKNGFTQYTYMMFRSETLTEKRVIDTKLPYALQDSGTP